jgi:hypothetical protein
VVDGPVRLLGRLAGDGDDSDDLLGAEGGRPAGPGSVVEEVLQGPSQWLRGRRLFGALEVGRRCDPAVAPVADGDAAEAQLLGDGRDAGVGRQGEEDRGTSDEALIGGLLSLEALQREALCRGDLESRRSWSSHRPTHSGRAWRICPGLKSTGPTPIPERHSCRLVLG